MSGTSIENAKTQFTCDFCESHAVAKTYAPKGTLREATVAVCGNCGLVQTVYGNDHDPRHPALSCDADWGNVRHGKGLRLKSAIDIIENHVADAKKVMDIGSNRGDFVSWLLENNEQAEVLAIEPDTRITVNSSRDERVTLRAERFENADIPEDAFDFIYCSHTLEHALSARQMLHGIYDALKPEGLVYIEVPNISSIVYPDIVEEFFMDKHSFHFDRKLLCDYCESIGFEILSGKDDDDPYYISLLMKRRAAGGMKNIFSPATETVDNMAGILQEYANVLASNRNKLSVLVQEKLLPLMERQNVSFWGASRIFDALVKYGGLKGRPFSLVDKFIWQVKSETHGYKIEKPEVLKSNPPHVVVVLARSSENQIIEMSRALGVRHNIKFSDLLAQC